jgi:hypothetical protein
MENGVAKILNVRENVSVPSPPLSVIVTVITADPADPGNCENCRLPVLCGLA